MKTLLLLLCLIATSASAQTVNHDYMNGSQINFECTYVKPSSAGNQHPRTPMQPPVAYIDDHTLFIYGGERDFDLQILSDDGAVVYTTYVASGVNEVELPSSITGNVTLQLYYCDYIFESVITL